jgi:glycosyltransferase involved in cell wall biosynthesis
MPPLISIVVPIHNRYRYLAATLHSIRSQTYPHFELILWDDGSTDHSLAIAHQFAQQDARIQIVAAPHQGLTAALRSAFALAQGDYLAWVDSDDWLAPTALAQTVDLLHHHPTVGLVYTHYLTMNEHDQILGLGSRCGLPYSPKRLLVNFMTFHFRLFRRRVFDQVGWHRSQLRTRSRL